MPSLRAGGIGVLLVWHGFAWMQCRNAAILSPLASSSAFAVEFASGPVVWRVAASEACFALPKHLGFRALASNNGRPLLYPTILWSLL